MESLNCQFCKKPTFICNCDKSLDDFKLLQNLGKVDTINKLKYTDLNISTMTINLIFNQYINVKLMSEKLPKTIEMVYKPDSKKSRVKKKKGTDAFYNSFDIKISIFDQDIISNVSIYIFENGKVKIAGVKTINTINTTIEQIIDMINFVPGSVEDPETLVAENVRISMVCSDFKIKPIKDDSDGWCLKQEHLKDLLVKDYNVSATFSPLAKYPGINCKYPSCFDPEKRVSILIFRSGSIIITGGKYSKDILNCYNFIIDVITKNSETLFYYDINEEIKQKKKSKKLK
jgi:TATA-box binding protein (TBP) (component of TFIID and TFIIIB)